MAGAKAQAPASIPASTRVLENLQERIAQQEEQIEKLQQSLNEERILLNKTIANMNVQAIRSADAPRETRPALVATPESRQTLPVISTGKAEPAGDLSRAIRNGSRANEKASPFAVRIGNATLTPLGFVDFTWFGRSSNVGSGIGTNFASVPFKTTPAGHLSENNFSAQNSRIGFRVDSQVFSAKVLGYFEADFLGNQPSDVFVTSNSNTLRMRNVFVDVRKGSWEFLGGQNWSLLTPNRKGLSPLPADIFYTQNMDTNYQAGLVWSRQGQFRIVYHPKGDWALGLSLENPQQYIGGSGGLAATAVTLPSALTPVLIPQLNNGAHLVTTGTAAITGGGNFTTPNPRPDIIFKGAYDGHLRGNDRSFHIEAGALIRSFKTTIPSGITSNFVNHTATAVSGTINANLEAAHHFRIFANTFFGQGGGRYVFGLAPDLIVRANGAISPVHTYSTVDGVEIGLGKSTNLSAYYGGVYIGRAAALDSDGSTPIGFGFTGSTTADNKSIQEVTIGLTQTFWKNPRYGALSLINQYSWLTRRPWVVDTGAPKAAKTNLFYMNLRYTLP